MKRYGLRWTAVVASVAMPVVGGAVGGVGGVAGIAVDTAEGLLVAGVVAVGALVAEDVAAAVAAIFAVSLL